MTHFLLTPPFLPSGITPQLRLICLTVLFCGIATQQSFAQQAGTSSVTVTNTSEYSADVQVDNGGTFQSVGTLQPEQGGTFPIPIGSKWRYVFQTPGGRVVEDFVVEDKPQQTWQLTAKRQATRPTPKPPGRPSTTPPVAPSSPQLVQTLPASAYSPVESPIVQILNFKGAVYTRHENGAVYRTVGGITEHGVDKREPFYPPNNLPIKQMFVANGGIYTVFEGKDGDLVYVSKPEGLGPGSGRTSGKTRMRLFVQPGMGLGGRDAIVADIKGFAVYRSADGHNLEGGGNTQNVYKGNLPITHMVTSKQGVYTVFKNGDGSVVYLSPQGINVSGKRGITQTVYKGSLPISDIVVQPGAGIDGKDAILTSFNDGWGGVYRSLDGLALGGGTNTHIEYPARTGIVKKMLIANGGVYTAFRGKYGPTGNVYFSPDGTNIGGSGGSQSTASTQSVTGSGGIQVLGLFAETGTGDRGADSIICAVTDKAGNVYSEYKSTSGVGLLSGSPYMSRSHLFRESWFEEEQVLQSNENLTADSTDPTVPLVAEPQYLGYDILEMHPYDFSQGNRGTHVQGQRTATAYPIFKRHTETYRAYGKNIPVGLTFEPKSYFKGKKNGVVCFSENERNNAFNVSVAFEGGAYGVTVGVSGAYGQERSKKSSTETTSIIGSAFQSHYYLIHNKRRMMLTDGFRQAVLDRNWSKLYNEYGTHYVLAALYGSRAMLDETIQKSTLEESFQQEWEAGYKAEVDAGPAGNAKLNLNAKGGDGERSAMSKTVSDYQLEVLGGQGSTTWEGYGGQSANYNLQPIRLVLRPVYELVRPEFFADIDRNQIMQLQKEMAIAYQKRVYNSSSDKPLKPDPIVNRWFPNTNQPITFRFNKITRTEENVVFSFVSADGTVRSIKGIDYTKNYYKGFGETPPNNVVKITRGTLTLSPVANGDRFDYGLQGAKLRVNVNGRSVEYPLEQYSMSNRETGYTKVLAGITGKIRNEPDFKNVYEDRVEGWLTTEEATYQPDAAEMPKASFEKIANHAR